MLGSIKSMIMIGALVAIITTVGSYFYFEKVKFNDLQKIIKTQREQIAGLELDNQNLLISNQSLNNELMRQTEEAQRAYEEIGRLRAADIESQKRLARIERQLRDRDRMDRIQHIRSSEKASLLLRLMDKQVKCYVDNFERFDGECIRGTFVPDGERLVPNE